MKWVTKVPNPPKASGGEAASGGSALVVVAAEPLGSLIGQGVRIGQAGKNLEVFGLFADPLPVGLMQALGNETADDGDQENPSDEDEREHASILAGRRRLGQGRTAHGDKVQVPIGSSAIARRTAAWRPGGRGQPA